jgi:hypothetical protein
MIFELVASFASVALATEQIFKNTESTGNERALILPLQGCSGHTTLRRSSNAEML